MTHPPELVEIVCARCGTVYTSYLTPVVDRDLEPWSDQGRSEAVVCPECGAALEGGDTVEAHAVGPHPSRDVMR